MSCKPITIKLTGNILNEFDCSFGVGVCVKAQSVLAHRIVLSPEARLRNMTAEKVLENVIASVKVPVKLP